MFKMRQWVLGIKSDDVNGPMGIRYPYNAVKTGQGRNVREIRTVIRKTQPEIRALKKIFVVKKRVVDNAVAEGDKRN